MSETIELAITGMSCGGCVSNVEIHLKAIEGVESALVSLDDGKAVVTGTANSDVLISAVKAAGYDARIDG